MKVITVSICVSASALHCMSVFICAFLHANMPVYMSVYPSCTHARMNICTSSPSSPHASRGPAQEKNPNTFRPERKTDFLDESLLVKQGPFIFLVIIIYSRHIDNAPTQTLQGIIHFARGDVAVPQIVQTTGQSPEPHNSKSKGRKKLLRATLLLF